MTPQVCLDSHSRERAPRSFTFCGLLREVRADRLQDVVPALEEVVQAVDAGHHAAGFLSYEAASGLDPVLATRRPGDLPLVWFGIFDRREETDPHVSTDDGSYTLSSWEPTTSREDYDRSIRRIRQYIEKGDTYQVNHTFRMQAAFSGDPAGFYQDLCRSQRASYCAFLDLGRHKILSASPELFFTLDRGTLTTRPMKGTRPRGRWASEDLALANELLSAEKDRAENLMIVDLLRNDVGRVAEIGSVSVPALWQVERYETVWQMTSTVTARLRQGSGPSEILQALFPCGSVTGAPKVRTMEIISELETSPRGVYTGSIGYISPGPEMAFNVAIRTVWIDSELGRAEFGVGGGITYDSSESGEYAECMVKARVLSDRRPALQLLETLRYDGDTGFHLLDRHLDRLEASARYFGFACDRSAVRGTLESEAECLNEGSHRCRLTLDDRGTVDIHIAPLDLSSDPFFVALCDRPVDSRYPLLYHKTTHRRLYDARLALYPGCDDVILLNERGELTECCIGNLVLGMAGQQFTPPVESGLLPGTFRADLIGRGLLHERVLVQADLDRAESLHLINGVRGWVPLSLVAPEGETWGRRTLPSEPIAAHASAGSHGD